MNGNFISVNTAHFRQSTVIIYHTTTAHNIQILYLAKDFIQQNRRNFFGDNKTRDYK